MAPRLKLQQRVKPVKAAGAQQPAINTFTGTLSASGRRLHTQQYSQQRTEASASKYSLNAQQLQTADTLDWGAEDILPAPEPSAPGIGDSLHANEIDEELEDCILASSHNTRGQNYMLSTWLREHCMQYCEKLLDGEHVDTTVVSCVSCEIVDAPFRCRTCFSNAMFCQSCIVEAHAKLPTHRIWKWTGQCFEATSLTALGAVFHLGHGGHICTNGHERSLYLGDTNGFHTINVRYCRHPGVDKDSHQLLAVNIYPCSDSAPGSAFTFNALKQFQLLANDSLLSAHRYYNVLVRLTNNAFPHVPDNRYREFLRVARQWELLQSRKRSGGAADVGGANVPSAMHCPACPRPGVNFNQADIESDEYLYSYQLSYDGNFHLVRKNKTYDEHDTCISDGTKYFVDQGEYKQYLEMVKDSAYAQNTKEASCNNHTAAKDTWVRQSGLAETGIGAVVCARHSMFLPGGTVNYFKGERFAYTDFAIANVLHQLKAQGIERVGFFYDIYCHWVKNWWARAAQIPLPLGPLYQEDFRTFLGGIPKFHLAGHTNGCYVQYSLNNTTGVGRLDAEGGERCWSHLNHAAGSTSEKGPGARIDAINSIMDHWNWCKCVEMISHLLRKWKNTLQMAEVQKDLFLQYSSSLESSTVSEWEGISTVPKLVNGIYESPFVIKETKDSSLAHKLKSMLDQESMELEASGTTPVAAGSAEWIVDGIDIEGLQERLRIDIKDHGSNPTDTQSLNVATRRKSLLQRIDAHKERAPTYLGGYSLDKSKEIERLVPGQSKTFTIHLPSRLSAVGGTSDAIKAVRLQERELRVVVCLKSLQLLCSLICQKAHLVGNQDKQAKSQRTVTRSQSLLSRLSARLDYERWRYQNARKYLLRLDPSSTETQRFQELRGDDVQGLLRIMTRKTELGQTNVALPWFWKVSFAENEGVTTEQQYQDNIKVEWFLARERYRRWDEEVLWLKREAASTVLDFTYRRDQWIQRAEGALRDNRHGARSYCYRQAQLWDTMRKDAVTRASPLLKYIPQHENLSICVRVLAEQAQT